MIAREFAEILGYSIEPVMLYQVSLSLTITSPLNHSGSVPCAAKSANATIYVLLVHDRHEKEKL